MEPDFHLAKWYLDCIADDGTTVIGYSARLSWKRLTLNYASYLLSGPGRETETATSLFVSEFPLRRNDSVEWSCKGLDLRGSWKQRFPSVEKELLRNMDGTIRWSCIMPGAEAWMKIGDETVQGNGYVEFLEMTIPVWKLPIEELRWGRFVTETDSVVWIDWKGTHPLRTVIHNGRPVTCDVVDDSMVRSADGQILLTLDRSTILRSGPLINTALKKMPMIESIIPKNVLMTDECKWLSRSSLHHRGKDSAGFSIHETVRFT